MIQDSKDTIANLTTIAGAGSAALSLNEILTLVLIVTGIILNLVRIYEMRRNSKK